MFLRPLAEVMQSVAGASMMLRDVERREAVKTRLAQDLVEESSFVQQMYLIAEGFNPKIGDALRADAKKTSESEGKRFCAVVMGFTWQLLRKEGDLRLFLTRGTTKHGAQLKRYTKEVKEARASLAGAAGMTPDERHAKVLLESIQAFHVIAETILPEWRFSLPTQPSLLDRGPSRTIREWLDLACLDNSEADFYSLCAGVGRHIRDVAFPDRDSNLPITPTSLSDALKRFVTKAGKDKVPHPTCTTDALVGGLLEAEAANEQATASVAAVVPGASSQGSANDRGEVHDAQAEVSTLHLELRPRRRPRTDDEEATAPAAGPSKKPRTGGEEATAPAAGPSKKPRTGGEEATAPAAGPSKEPRTGGRKGKGKDEQGQDIKEENERLAAQVAELTRLLESEEGKKGAKGKAPAVAPADEGEEGEEQDSESESSEDEFKDVLEDVLEEPEDAHERRGVADEAVMQVVGKGKGKEVAQEAELIDLTVDDDVDPFLKAILAPQAAKTGVQNLVQEIRVGDMEKARQSVMQLVLLLKKEFEKLKGEGEDNARKSSRKESVDDAH
ncbi:hypothetical protein HK101_007437 [Irineochytrium annulatum]|nr:hypothetical protein HK101_007437 [Irineochytrium annulatum]